MKTVYGPIPSWRLGRSLGVDLIAGEKTCSFDCTYCQLGPTKHKTMERRLFAETSRLERDLHSILDMVKADIVTFSGTGEHTLASNLGDAVDVVRNITGLPVAILTNSSLMFMEDVRRTLAKFDIVVAKLDASNEDLLQRINRPTAGITIEEIIGGIKNFRKMYEGKLALQIMFMKENASYADKLADLAREIKPDEVQINTPLRPSQVKPLAPEQVEEIESKFKGLNTISVYHQEKLDVEVADMEETLARRAVL